jgi:FAD-linked sulfhydryl oxidase
MTKNQNSMEPEENLDVRIWGPKAWDFMHAVTFAYPSEAPSEEDKQNIIQFFDSIGNCLPCAKCRFHFKEMLKKWPVPTFNREELTKWLVDRHNDVNVRLGKPVYPYDFVKKRHQDMSNMCPAAEAACTEALKKCSPETETHDETAYGSGSPDYSLTIEQENRNQNQKKWFILLTSGSGILLLFLCIIGAIYCYKKK